MQPDNLFHQSEALTQARVDIARLEATVEAQGTAINELKDTVGELRDAVLAVQGTLSEARGGWRTLVWIGTGCASLGAGLAWVFEQLLRRVP